MFGFTLKAAKAGFFDRARVLRAADKSTRKVLSRFGAFVRTRARSSIRKRKGTSAPGQPPHGHIGLLKRFILFGYDVVKRSVVIGPTLLRKGAKAPRLLEHGGDTVNEDQGKTRTLHYRPRPFMGPAFEKEKTQLPALWRDSVR